MIPRVRHAAEVLWDWGRAGLDLAAAGYSRLRRRLPAAHAESRCSAIPLVVLPGVLEPWRYMLPLGTWLSTQGHPVHYVRRLGFNLGGLEASVVRVLELLDDEQLNDAVFVAHSKGGLIGKAALASPALEGRVTGMVTLATPFRGSGLGGRFQRLPLVKRSPFGMFVEGSDALLSLQAQEHVNAHIVTMAPEWDQVVAPESTWLPGGTNVTLPVAGHFRPLRNPEVWKAMHHHIHQLPQPPANGSSGNQTEPAREPGCHSPDEEVRRPTSDQ